MDPALLLFAIPIGLGLFLPVAAGGLYFYEKRHKKRIRRKPARPRIGAMPTPQPHRKIVADVIADLLARPESWTIRWDVNTHKVRETCKSMESAQALRTNTVAVEPNGKLAFCRGLKETRKATHYVDLTDDEQIALKSAFDSLIAAKLDGALHQHVV